MKPARIDTLAALLLLIVFTALTLLLVVSTGGAYRSIRQQGLRQQNVRTGLSFIATRVRESESGCVEVVTAPWGGSALVIRESSGAEEHGSEEHDSGEYEDWIYSTGSTLREVLVPHGTSFEPASGQAISQPGRVDFTCAGSRLEIRIDGGRPALTLALVG